MAKQSLQSPHWVDKLVTEMLEWQQQQQVDQLHVDDMKTPSGRVHTGSLEGVIYHDFFAKGLAAKTDQPITSTFVINDMDPMDGMPSYLDATKYDQHMGKPLFQIPRPNLDESGIDMTKATAAEKKDFERAKSFAEFYAFDFEHAFRKMGCDQKLVWSHQLYQSGQMDEAIKLVLDNVDELKKIYREVAEYELPKQWYPFQVICPECGKVGTTLTTDWDGEQISFECQPNKVEWAKGCGHSGKISPFGGNGKLLWKVDWPAHWKVMGVTVEGAGKDHTSAGGSRDMANAICERVLGITVPFDVPYEWILIRGTKMSSSKGVGTSAREFTELFPTALGRFLFANKHYNQVLDFDPTSMAIPDLFDLFDQGARVFWEQEEGDVRLGRSFELSHNGSTPAAQFLPRFRDLAKWMQHPEMDLAEEFAKIKGSDLTETELATLRERQKYAQIWIDRYAPLEFQLTPGEEVPATVGDLSDEQKKYLVEVDHLLDSKENWDAAELQQALFDLAKGSLGARAAFQAIYLAFIGQKSGPRAAWFLLSIDEKLRKTRIGQLSSAQSNSKTEHLYQPLTDTNLLSFSPEFAKTYPSAIVGVAVINGVKISKTNLKLEAEKSALLIDLAGLTNQDIGNFPEITSYRKMYKQMGIDWHSRRPSPEALLRRVAQGKDLYQVNTCVDAYNLVVMKHRVSVGAFDHDQIQYPTQIQVAKGGEEILLLGDTEPKQLKAGEVSYFDQTGPYNMDYNYRDAQRTMITDQTTNLLINVDGIHDITTSQVEQSLQEVIEMITKYCGGTVEQVGVVTAE